LVTAKDHDDLLLDRHRLELRLLENFHCARAALELLLRRCVEVRLRTMRMLRARDTVQVESQTPATDFIALICAFPPTRDTEIPTFTAGRTPA
jgi:hypothetical protein